MKLRTSLQLAAMALTALSLAGCAAHEPIGTILARDGRAAETFDAFDWSGASEGWISEPASRIERSPVWEVCHDSDGNAFLAVTSARDVPYWSHNLYWCKGVALEDGAVSAMVRADAGFIDRGGGVAWRISSAGNCYMAGYDPFDSHLCLYAMKNGTRELIAAERIDRIPSGKWFRVSARYTGTEINVGIDGREVIQIDDSSFADAGGIGVWTKGTALTSFDDVAVVRVRE